MGGWRQWRYRGDMKSFSPGVRVTTASGNLIGTVIEMLGSDDVLLEWDAEAGPQEDEGPASMLHAIASSRDSQAPQRPQGSAPPR